MNNVELFSFCSDKELEKIFLGKLVDVIFSDLNVYSGVITRFINATQCNDSERKIVGIIIDDEKEIAITDLIKDIIIYN